MLPDEGEAANLEIVSGDGQTGPAGSPLAQQVVVRLTDTRGRAVTDHDVSFSIGSGAGAVAPATVKSNATGQAAAGWTLGPSTGRQLLRVQTARGGSGTLEVSFQATAVAGSGSTLAEFDGDEQTGPVNSALADSLVVKATDALGNPVAGVEVTWTVSGGGSIAPATGVTGAEGLAAAERVLGPTAGPQSAQAAVNGFAGSPVTFTHTAVPANPTALLLISGDDQIAPGGFEVAEDLVVRLEDANGNGIGGRSITWVVPVGSGSVNPVNSTTDPTGLATTRWTLPNAAGGYSVSAVFSGLPAVPFTATATADVPTTIELVSGNNQSAAVGSPLPNPLVVRVTDANDNPVANVSVIWTVTDGGSVSDPTTATNASGLAQVTRTLGLLPGQYTTTAAVDGLAGSPITFTSTADEGAPAQLVILTAPGSPTTSGEAFNPSPVIQVQDAQGNPVSRGGIPIRADISSGHPGDLENEQKNTNGNGRVTFNNLRITGPPDNDYVLTFSASVDGTVLTPAISSFLTVTAGAANRIAILTQPSPTAANGAVFPAQPVVQVQDAGGNPVPTAGLTITAAIQDGPGTLGPTPTVNATTDGNGTATFAGLSITGVIGSRTLSFSRPGLVSVESSQINITAGSPSSLAIQAGGGTQTAGVGEDVPTPPAVIVTDQSGNRVSGVSVDFHVTSGSGNVEPGTVATGSDGIAAVTRWTLGSTAGANTLQASVPSAPGLGTETFNATGTATTTTILTENPNPSTVGQDVTFTATVSSGGGTPTGQVQFLNGAAGLGDPVDLIGGVATLTTPDLPAGLHSISAQYLGTAIFVGSTSNTVLQDVQ